MDSISLLERTRLLSEVHQIFSMHVMGRILMLKEYFDICFGIWFLLPETLRKMLEKCFFWSCVSSLILHTIKDRYFFQLFCCHELDYILKALVQIHSKNLVTIDCRYSKYFVQSSLHQLTSLLCTLLEWLFWMSKIVSSYNCHNFMCFIVEWSHLAVVPSRMNFHKTLVALTCYFSHWFSVWLQVCSHCVSWRLAVLFL